MRWEDERYVRVYTRDTGEWLALGWEAQALFLFALRKSDRAGIVRTGKAGMRGLAGMTGMPLEVVARALPLLLEDGCMRESEGGYIIPNFIAAQEVPISDAQRKRDQRERDRDKELARGGCRQKTAADITATTSRRTVTQGSHAEESRLESHTGVTPEVTSGHAGSVTPNRAVPNRAEPSEETTLSASADSPPEESAADLRALWNTEADPRLPRWRDMTDKRRQQAQARLRERPLAEWRIILGRINGSPFCLGQNERGWKADVEFFLRPDTATRVLEGKYDVATVQPPRATPPNVMRGSVRAELFNHDRPEEPF